jgi:hypothetical protein
MLACKETSSQTLKLLAWAPRVDVLTDTGPPGIDEGANLDASTLSNGTQWYYGIKEGARLGSMGFAVAGDELRKNICDPLETGSAEH